MKGTVGSRGEGQFVIELTFAFSPAVLIGTGSAAVGIVMSVHSKAGVGGERRVGFRLVGVSAVEPGGVAQALLPDSVIEIFHWIGQAPSDH